MAKLNRFFKTIAGTVMSLALIGSAIPMTAMPASAATITFLQGDVDGNGRITLADVTMFTRYINGGLNATAEQITRMDAVQNKVIEMQDYNKIFNCYFNSETAQTVTSDVYTSITDQSRTYAVYDYATDTEVNRYTLESSSATTASINTRTIEQYDDYRDMENINTVKILTPVPHDNTKVYVSSGFIIDNHIVATCAHSLYRKNEVTYQYGFSTNAEMIVYDESGVNEVARYTAESAHVPTSYMGLLAMNSTLRYSYDYALLYFEEDLSSHGIWSLGCMTTEFNSTGSNVISTGFTGSNEEGSTKPAARYYSEGPIMSNPANSNMFRAECMVYEGKSGGPVYYTVNYNGSPVKSVIGINSYYNDTSHDVQGPRITPTLIRFFLNNSYI